MEGFLGFVVGDDLCPPPVGFFEKDVVEGFSGSVVGDDLGPPAIL